MATTPRHPHFTTMPREIRRQILVDTLRSEISQYIPHSFGHRTLPFDRFVHAVFARVCDLKVHERRHWGRPGFWGREPMTRLMRVNKQLYEEVYVLLWSDFALGLWAPNLDDNHIEWMRWLQTHNPRAIPLVRHLHLRLHQTFDESDWDPHDAAYHHDLVTKDTSERIQEQINSYPGLISVRLQISLVGKSGTPSEEIQAVFKERVMRYVASCGTTLRIMVFWEPDADKSWAGAAMRECQDRIGQIERMPPLHRQFLEHFPATSKEDPYG